MSEMRHATSATSAIFQLVYVFGLFVFLYSLFFLFRADGPFLAGDARMAAGEVSQALVTFVLRACIGLVGAGLGWYVLRHEQSAPTWFVRFSKSLAFVWLVFIPIGTVLGFFMFRWCKRANTEVVVP